MNDEEKRLSQEEDDDLLDHTREDAAPSAEAPAEGEIPSVEAPMTEDEPSAEAPFADEETPAEVPDGSSGARMRLGDLLNKANQMEASADILQKLEKSFEKVDAIKEEVRDDVERKIGREEVMQELHTPADLEIEDAAEDVPAWKATGASILDEREAAQQRMIEEWRTSDTQRRTEREAYEQSMREEREAYEAKLRAEREERRQQSSAGRTALDEARRAREEALRIAREAQDAQLRAERQAREMEFRARSGLGPIEPDEEENPDE